MITAKLHDGISINVILDSVWDNVHGDNVTHAELVSHQDIHNIRHQYIIEGVQYHSNDHCSVHLWLENMKSCDTDLQFPVLLYKQQVLSKLMT